MPELPEVETIKNELAPYIIGRSVTDVNLFWEGIVRQPSVREFRSRLIGQRLTDIGRRGKYLILSLSSDDFLVIHLKMSGALLIGRHSSEPSKYTRAVIQLDKDINIFFRDPRKFGAMWLVTDKNEVDSKLGPEPLEAHFTPQFLSQLLARHKAPIKALLLDQSLIAGIGNMYADEALFVAKIHPLRLGNSLSPEEVKRLYIAIRQVLHSGINDKGASVLNYIRPDGTLGTAYSHFKVAHRGGEPCPVCGTPIQRLPIRNRGSYFCPKCQPAPG